MSIQSLPSRTQSSSLTLSASAWSSFATPAITVPFPSAYAGQTQIPFVYTSKPISSRSRETIGANAATGVIVAPKPTTTGVVSSGNSNAGTKGGPILPTWAVAVIAVVGGVAIVCFILGLWCCCTSRKSKKGKLASGKMMKEKGFGEDSEDTIIGASAGMTEKRARKFKSAKTAVKASPKGNIFGISGLPPIDTRSRLERQRSMQAFRSEGKGGAGTDYGHLPQANPVFPLVPPPVVIHDDNRGSFDSSTPLNPSGSREGYSEIDLSPRRPPRSPQRPVSIGLPIGTTLPSPTTPHFIQPGEESRRRVQSERSHFYPQRIPTLSQSHPPSSSSGLAPAFMDRSMDGSNGATHFPSSRTLPMIYPREDGAGEGRMRHSSYTSASPQQEEGNLLPNPFQ